MLKLFDGRLGRRSFLTIGSAALGGWSLPGMLRAKESPVGRAVKGRSVVVLNLQGGPTQFETFDPNMQAPEEIRSITGETKTSLPGVTFGGTLPLLAARAHQMSIVRSYRHGISSHGPAAMHVMAGGNPTGAQMGALTAPPNAAWTGRCGPPRSTRASSECCRR